MEFWTCPLATILLLGLLLPIWAAPLVGCGDHLRCGEGTLQVEDRCVLAQDACGKGATLREGRCVVVTEDLEPSQDPTNEVEAPEGPDDSAQPPPEVPEQVCAVDGERRESPENCGFNGAGRWVFECVDGAWEILYCDAIRAWSVNEQTACVIDAIGGLYCWGLDWCGQMGLGAEWFETGQFPSSYEVPTRIDTLPPDLVAVHHVGDSRCVLATDGQVYCSGHRSRGLIGDGEENVPSIDIASCPQSHTMAPTPVAVPGLSNIEQLVAGTNGYCARRDDNAVFCWGNLFNQYADGAFFASPTAITDLPATIDSLHAGYSHFCATSLGDLYCWGWGSAGVLKTGDYDSRLNARRVNLPAAVVDVALENHTCALLINDELYCWGPNIGGRLGIGNESFTNFPIPQLVGSFPGARLDPMSGICLIDGEGQALCWGTNDRAQAGVTPAEPGPDLNAGAHISPVAVEGDLLFRQLTRQTYWRSCGITQDWRLVCWGINNSGELGRGLASDFELPDYVSGTRTFSQVNLQGQHLTLALSRDGHLYTAGESYGHSPAHRALVLERLW